ncbi:MAG: winged helix-turn-helix transcriptional regulator [Rhodobacter sp.]|nr:winged helix-turn-helix transcriptional regulator [Rhodobacter sp.]
MAPDGKNLRDAEDLSQPQWQDGECQAASIPADVLAEEARMAADFLKALGHEGRLMMLYHLCDRDHSVTELEQLIHSRQAAVSQQLARLRHEKLVSTRREGNQIFYSLADPKVREMVRVIQRLFRNHPRRR